MVTVTTVQSPRQLGELAELVESGEWTLAEARRLLFARWLAATGRLSEAAERPGGAKCS